MIYSGNLLSIQKDSYECSQKRRKKSVEGLPVNFDKANFFAYVEGYVINSLARDGMFEPGKIEWFIVDYFERFVFQGKEFHYMPEFDEVIFELLHKHRDKLVSFINTESPIKDAMFPDEAKMKYLTLVDPRFGTSKRGLLRSLLDIEVAHRRRMNQVSNRVRRTLGRLGYKKS